jgi:hypothetical protein
MLIASCTQAVVFYMAQYLAVVLLDNRVSEAEMAKMDNAYLAAYVAMFACCCRSCQSPCEITAASQVSTCLATTSGQRGCRCGQSTGTSAGSCHHTTQLSLTQLPGCAACDVSTLVACLSTALRWFVNSTALGPWVSLRSCSITQRLFMQMSVVHAHASLSCAVLCCVVLGCIHTGSG